MKMSTHDLLDKLDGIGLISNVNRLTDSTFPGENPLVSRHRPGTNMKVKIIDVIAIQSVWKSSKKSQFNFCTENGQYCIGRFKG